MFAVTGDYFEIDQRFLYSGGRITANDYTDNTVERLPIDQERVAQNRVRLKFYETEDGTKLTLTYNFFFNTPTSGVFSVSAYADGFGTFARGEGSFTYSEPGL